MSFLILPGRYLNILDGALSITSSDPEAGYDAENVTNSVPSHPFKFDDPGTDDYITADLQRLSNGDMETWAVDSLPDGWETDGTVAKDDTNEHGGTYCAKLSGNGWLTQTIWVPSGWVMTIEAWLYGDATYSIDAYVKNLYTGSWLDSGSVWQSSTAEYGDVTAASWSKVTVDFTVEDFATCGYQHLVPLQISFYMATPGGSFGYIDDVAIWPHWNFASIHGHNIPPSIAVKHQSDSVSGMSSPTTQATATVIQPAFFDVIETIVTERYARLFLDGDVYQEASIYIGEWVLGQYKTLTEGHRYGPSYLRTMPITEGSAISRTPRSDWSYRGLILNFTNNDAALTNMYEMLDRARGGADPCIVVPVDTESTVMFGYFPTELGVNRLFKDHQAYSLEFNEMAFPFSF